MAHQRILKPEFFTDADMGEMPPLYRLFYMGLWTQADRNGTLEDKPRQLKARVMPYDEMDAGCALDELVLRGKLTRFKVGDKRLLAIASWKKNQSVHSNEKDSGLPDISQATEVSETPPPVEPIPVITGSKPSADGAGTESFPNLTALPVPVPVPVPSPVPAPVPTPAAAAPPGVGLRERLEAVFLQAKGTAFQWEMAHERDLERVIAFGEAEVARRWLIALDTPFPRCGSVRELVKNWNHYATPPPTAKERPKESRVSRADAQDWSGDGGYGAANKKASSL